MKAKSATAIKIAACQMNSIDDVESNKLQIRSFLKNFESSLGHVDLVSFPENSLYFRIQPSEMNTGILKSDKFFSELGAWAKQNQTSIHLGSVALKDERAKLSNVTMWINHQGEMSFPYSKIHLFDVDVDGEKPVRESDYFNAGEKPAIVEVDQFKFGLSICYDLRFPELFLTYAKAEVDAILIPSAFLVTTGKAHWHSLMRARAIETQAYVIAAAQGGDHISASGAKRSTFGHSLIVDPWGEVISEIDSGLDSGLGSGLNSGTASAGQNFITHTLQKEMIERVRKQIPMRHHRRL